MSPLGSLVLLTAIGAVGLLAIISGVMQPAPPLHRVLASLRRERSTTPDERMSGRLMGQLVEWFRSSPRLLPSEIELRLVGRRVEQHVSFLVLAAISGFAIPTTVLWTLQSSGAVGLGWFVPLIVGLVAAVLAPLIVHLATVERAQATRSDLRYQVSAYLDVVTMLLAGNTGYEGALEQAAHAGDGRLFSELRRRMRESAARGASLTSALDRTGVELGLDELEQVAATAALSAAEGAPVARTLSAKCSTLRATLAAEQEAEARLRTSRLTSPIVGMALIFMALVIYPALSFS